MIDAGVSKDDSIIGSLIAEHQLGRHLSVLMTDQIVNNNDYAAFIKSSIEYDELLKNHMLKENNILFLIADNVLSKSHMDDIYLRFIKHEVKSIGKNRYEELKLAIVSLKSRYLN